MIRLTNHISLSEHLKLLYNIIQLFIETIFHFLAHATLSRRRFLLLHFRYRQFRRRIKVLIFDFRVRIKLLFMINKNGLLTISVLKLFHLLLETLILLVSWLILLSCRISGTSGRSTSLAERTSEFTDGRFGTAAASTLALWTRRWRLRMLVLISKSTLNFLLSSARSLLLMLLLFLKNSHLTRLNFYSFVNYIQYFLIKLLQHYLWTMLHFLLSLLYHLRLL